MLEPRFRVYQEVIDQSTGYEGIVHGIEEVIEHGVSVFVYAVKLHRFDSETYHPEACLRATRGMRDLSQEQKDQLTCQRKRPFTSAKHAEIQLLRVREHLPSYHTVEPYECPSCHLWHLGHPKGESVRG